MVRKLQSRMGPINEACNVILPFQTIEQVDEPRAEKPSDTALQGDLFATDSRGRQLKGWTNKLIWGDNYVFENEWQSIRTKKDRTLELTSAAHKCEPGRRKVAVKVVDIFGNDTMKILEVDVK